ncbi:MAG TPA: ribosome silencing factor [bacterium]|nr:ribosome silencing factor [bacterium]HPP30241.1 ribosome silencing factor [bacterium]
MVAILENKKAEDIKVLYVGNQTWITDYFIIASGNSSIHTKTLAESLLDGIEEHPVSIDGLKRGRWVLIDYAEVIVHIFLPEVRNYYKLEKLWAEV